MANTRKLKTLSPEETKIVLSLIRAGNPFGLASELAHHARLSDAEEVARAMSTLSEWYGEPLDVFWQTSSAIIQESADLLEANGAINSSLRRKIEDFRASIPR